MDSRTGAWGLDTSTPEWAQANRAPFLANQTWERDSFQHQGPGVFGRYLSGFDQGGIFDYAKKLEQENDAFFAANPQSGGGPVNAKGGNWATLDGMNGGIAKASATTKNKVPPNLLKALLAVEGSYGNDWGRAPVVTSEGRTVNPFNGMVYDTAVANGYDWNRIQTDQNYAIWTSADVLDRLYSQYGGQYGWDGVIKAYFSGNPTGTFANGRTADENGEQSNDYFASVKAGWNDLDGGAGGGGAGSGNLGGMFGANAAVPDWGEFNAPSANGLYGYGTQYGLNGSNHTGIDVPLALNSPMKAPMGGTVLCAGTGNGSDENGGSCAAFNNYMGNSGYGAGRIEIRLDSGAVLIFGHSASSAVQPGQHVNAGDLLGYSGGENSAHVHLEARVPDPSTPSGWRIVDPRSLLGGGGVSSATVGAGGAGIGGGASGAPSGSGPYWWNQPLDQLLKGAR